MTTLFDKIIQFILYMTSKYKIDDSHGISHSFDILHHTYELYREECEKNPELQNQEKIIYISALLHDVCDKKYMNEEQGMNEIIEFLSERDLDSNEITIIRRIIETMSYSKVIKNGFPDLGEYQLAYHIVRESDLLCAYNVDRCIIFHLHNQTKNIEQAILNAETLFQERVFKHQENGLILLNYSKRMIPFLENQSMVRLERLKKIQISGMRAKTASGGASL